MTSKRNSGLAGWLENKSINQRLTVQILSTVVASICLVITFLIGGWVMLGNRDSVAQASDQALYAALLEKDFASLERDVFRHALLRSDKTREDLDGNVKDLKTSIDDTRSHLEADQVASADQVATNAEAYVAHVNDALSQGEVDEAAETAISDSGDTVDNSIESIREPAVATAAEMQAAQKRTMHIVMGSSVLIALIAGVITLLLARAIRNAISRDIEAMSHAIAGIARGDLSVEIGHEHRDDQIGTLARAAIQLRETSRAKQEADAEMVDMARKVGDALGRLAKGDLTIHVPELGRNFVGLRDDFNKAIEQLNQTMASVSESAGSIRGGAGEISQASGDLAERTEHHASELAHVAEAVDQITKALQESTGLASQAHQGVREAVTEARSGAEIVGKAVGAMANIEKSSDEIGQIINVIDGIAFQTNLLALNAGVEAARAGDAGKGFAVVANEVRALAQRSADAAKDIKALITQSGTEVQDGVQMVRQAGEALRQISARIDGITEMVTQITQSSTEQSSRLGEINTAMAKMDHVTQQNAAMVEESTAAARSLLNESDILNASVQRFTCSGTPARTDKRPAPLASASRPTTKARPSRTPPAVAGNLALAVNPSPAVHDEDWAEF